tara:strand:- start:3927 stop:4193 length:267 start_codon:yes stop_codon:yes gene_type:complete
MAAGQQRDQQPFHQHVVTDQRRADLTAQTRDGIGFNPDVVHRLLLALNGASLPRKRAPRQPGSTNRPCHFGLIGARPGAGPTDRANLS